MATEEKRSSTELRKVTLDLNGSKARRAQKARAPLSSALPRRRIWWRPFEALLLSFMSRAFDEQAPASARRPEQGTGWDEMPSGYSHIRPAIQA